MQAIIRRKNKPVGVHWFFYFKERAINIIKTIFLPINLLQKKLVTFFQKPFKMKKSHNWSIHL